MKLPKPVAPCFLSAAVVGVTVVLSSLTLTGCGASQNKSNSAAPVTELATVQVANPGATARSDQAVDLPLAELGLTADSDFSTLGFFNQGNPIAHQIIDSDGDGQKDTALLLTDLPPAAKMSLTMRNDLTPEKNSEKKRTHAELGVKAGGRWNGQIYEGGVFQDVDSITLPPQVTDHSHFLRYEGPGIESEQVGYRVYLDWRNGFDIFGKVDHNLHLSGVGLDGYDSYHELSDWGMDILKVGDAVGVGGYGLWRDGAVQRVSKVGEWSAKIVEDGDLYSAFAIHYKDWNTGDLVTDLEAQMAIVAGSRSVQVTLKTDPAIDAMAIGIVKAKNTQVFQGNLDITGEAWSYLATLGSDQALDGSPLLMYVLFQKEDFEQFIEDKINQGVLLDLKGGELEYYFGAQWGREPGADLSPAAVKKMLQAEVERLTLQPRLAVDNQSSDNLKAELGGASSGNEWSRRAAAAEIERHGHELALGEYDTMRQRQANWEYTTGMLAQAVYGLGKSLPDAEFERWGKHIIDSYITADGTIQTYDKTSFNIDSINSGKMLLQLYRDTGEEKYRLAADKLREQLADHPRLDAGAFWHKQRYPYQLWLDGVYMGMPFLAEYSVLFEQGQSLEEVMQEFHVAREVLRDPKTGLYFHAYDEKRQQNWADKKSGLSSYFWSRGMGWLAMALADTYAIVPAEEKAMRAELSAMAQELADALLKYQTDAGVWLQITNMPNAPGNYAESSGTAMFAYLLVKGVATGMLPESYKPTALNAYQALVENFVQVDANNLLSVTQVCAVAGLGYGRDGSYNYYMSEPVVADDPKALAPFIMLGPLVQQLDQG